MDIVKVVCGIIFKDNKIFICRRKEGKALAGFWEFPGGKVELGETNEESLKRELKEELDMEVEINNCIGNFTHEYVKTTIELIGYECTLLSYQGKLTDHDAYEWVESERLLTYRLAPADIPIAKEYINEQTQTVRNREKRA